jgi:hypothetical protein
MGTSRLARSRAIVCAPLVLALAAGVASAGRRGRPDGALAPSTTYAAFVMTEIADAAGMRSGVPIYRAPVTAAHAILVDGREAIVYNPGFLDEVNDRAGTSWAAVSVIAHELGHHYYGHSHTPVEALPSVTLHEHELEADYFSGFVLARMGASREDAEAAQEALFSRADSPTHPDSYRRLDAISAGWSDGAGSGAPSSNPSARLAGPVRGDATGLVSSFGSEGDRRSFPSGPW